MGWYKRAQSDFNSIVRIISVLLYDAARDVPVSNDKILQLVQLIPDEMTLNGAAQRALELLGQAEPVPQQIAVFQNIRDAFSNSGQNTKQQDSQNQVGPNMSDQVYSPSNEQFLQ